VARDPRAAHPRPTPDRQALDAGEGDREGYLALRVATRYSYARISAVTTDPWGDLQSGRHAALASMKLTRLGLTRRAARASLPRI